MRFVSLLLPLVSLLPGVIRGCRPNYCPAIETTTESTTTLGTTPTTTEPTTTTTTPAPCVACTASTNNYFACPGQMAGTDFIVDDYTTACRVGCGDGQTLYYIGTNNASAQAPSNTEQCSGTTWLGLPAAARYFTCAIDSPATDPAAVDGFPASCVTPTQTSDGGQCATNTGSTCDQKFYYYKGADGSYYVACVDGALWDPYGAFSAQTITSATCDDVAGKPTVACSQGSATLSQCLGSVNGAAEARCGGSTCKIYCTGGATLTADVDGGNASLEYVICEFGTLFQTRGTFAATNVKCS